MKTRAGLFSIFQKFYAEILTQFNISIRVLRSYNAREYFSAPFISFMSQHGILHQSSCAHTPQQNGVAERKNRHLIETARTLLLHYKNVRIAWLLKDILRFMVLIMVTPSPPLPRLLLSVCFSPWLLCVPGRFFSWILKMPSFMVISLRKFIWSNHLVLLLKGSLV